MFLLSKWGQDIALYGIDWNAPLGTDDDNTAMIEVPMIETPPNDRDYSELCTLIDPTTSTDFYGIDQYRLALEFVTDKLTEF